MRTLRRLSAVFLLTLTLTLSAYAGHIPYPGITDDPPLSTQQATTTGDIETGVTGDMGTGVTGNISTSITGDIPNGVTITDPTTDVFLSLLQSLLSLF